MARLTAASAAAWLALGAAPMARAARARGGLRAAFLTGSEPAIGPGAGAPVVVWEQARAAGGAACTSLARVGPPSPRYFRALRIEASRGFFRRWKGRFAWALVALSSSFPTGLASRFDDREPHPHSVFLGFLARSSTRGQPRATNPLTKKGHNSLSTRGKRRGSNWAASRRENGQKP